MRVILGPYPGVRSKKERKMSIRIDDYDVWNLDHTLAHIIHPALVKLKGKKHGSPHVDDVDVPEHLRSTVSPPVENIGDVDDNWHLRWEWVLDEMIWAFNEWKLDEWEDKFHSGNIDFKRVPSDDIEGATEVVHGPDHTWKWDRDGHEKHYARIMNGIRLFGRYYGGLWD